MIESWKQITIGDLGKVVTGNTPPRKRPELYGDHTIFVKPTDINIGEKHCYQPEECYSDLGFAKYKKSLIPKDATCVVTIGSIGQKMIMAHTDLFINQAMNAIIPNDNYDKNFVYYLLKLNLFQLKIFDSGTASGRENVSKSSFSNIKVEVPESKETQSKIATILSAYDDLIENNGNRIKLLEEKAQLTYEEWFVRMKFPGHETTAINEETGLPEGWEKGKLSELIGYQSGFAYKSAKFTVEGFPVIKIKNIDNNTIETSNTNFIDEVYAYQTDKFKLNERDLLIAMTGATVGKVGIVPITKVPCYLNQRVGRFLKIGEVDNASFVNNFFTIGGGLNHVLNIAGGAAQPNISANQILSIDSIIPPFEILERFSVLAIKNTKENLNLQKQNQLLKEARDILLPRLMTGMIDVEHMNIETLQPAH